MVELAGTEPVEETEHIGFGNGNLLGEVGVKTRCP
jgi:hypothetical protein